MARVPLPGVLLLAILCGVGETADACQNENTDQMRLCANKTMSHKRDKLDARINASFSNIHLPRRNIRTPGRSIQLSLTNIRVEHASNIYLKGSEYNVVLTPGVSITYIVFHCYWQPSITVAMDAKFELCDPPSSHCRNFDARPSVTVEAAEFNKTWWKDGTRQPGKMEFEPGKMEIHLNVIGSTFSLPEWNRWKSQMKRSVVSGMKRLMSNLSLVLDGWFDNDVFPSFAKEVAG